MAGPAFKINVLPDGRIKVDADAMGQGVYHLTADKLLAKLIELTGATRAEVTREKRQGTHHHGHDHEHGGDHVHA